VIKHLKHKEINVKKYDACIAKAKNSRVYAYSWYLNIVCHNDWEILILDDYKAVMPLAFKRVKKQFLKRKIVQAHFCQQLGVFSGSMITNDVMNVFITNFIKLNPVNYNFNADNSTLLIDENKFLKRDNYELNLNTDYSLISKNYTKGLKSNIKKGQTNDLKIIKDLSFSEFKQLKIDNSRHKINRNLFAIMQAITTELIDRKLGEFYAVYKDSELVSASFFINTKYRITYLLSANNDHGKTFGATSFLLNHVIKTNSNTNKIFDFEGSMIPGVAKFFKSFGSKNNPYLVYSKK
jgi:hypothetical protein